MVTSMQQRQTETGGHGRWRLATIVLAVIAIGALIWAFNLRNRVSELETAQGQMPMTSQQSGGMTGHTGTAQHGVNTGSSMATDLGPANADYDKRFIDAMIPHHESAVDMAQDALNKSKREEVRNMSQAIIDAQTSEINQLKSWRQNWY
jgi:uncharacterized protein (DUF305 family)